MLENVSKTIPFFRDLVNKIIFLNTAFMQFHGIVYFQLLKKDEDGNINKSALTSCRQIVDCLVENVLRLEERSVGKASPYRPFDKLVKLKLLIMTFFLSCNTFFLFTAFTTR